MWDKRLWELPLDAAAERRWLEGRWERGLDPDAPFQGDPVEELFEELIDGIVYAGVASGQLSGSDARLFEEIESTLRDLAQSVATYLTGRTGNARDS